MKLSRADVDIEVFRRSRGNGGQHNNKTATSIRMTHIATGVRVEACKERSQRANLEAAYEALANKLNEMKQEAASSRRKAEYEAKPDASFGSKIRTYNLPERYVVDHRTGYKTRDPKAVLDGGIEGFIRSTLLARGVNPET